MSDAGTGMSEERLVGLRCGYCDCYAVVVFYDEIRRLQKEAATREADAAAMRAELEQHEHTDITYGPPACQACGHRETDDPKHAADCSWKAALDGSAGRELAKWLKTLQPWQLSYDDDYGYWFTSDKPPAWLEQAADGGTK